MAAIPKINLLLQGYKMQLKTQPLETKNCQPLEMKIAKKARSHPIKKLIFLKSGMGKLILQINKLAFTCNKENTLLL